MCCRYFYLLGFELKFRVFRLHSHLAVFYRFGSDELDTFQNMIYVYIKYNVIAIMDTIGILKAHPTSLIIDHDSNKIFINSEGS
mgnify:CR=1 FL=1